VSLIEHFHTALSASADELPGVELLPERLARASAEVLPVAGAGISLCFSPGRHLPLGASDPTSGEVERQQFTTGEGPCVASHDSGEPVRATEATLHSRWPGFYDAMATRTPVRSILTLPLPDELLGVGALDLYLRPPEGADALDGEDAVTIGEQVTDVLQTASRTGRSTSELPGWTDAHPARRRALVWQAIGLVSSSLRVPGPDALSVLRAHAYSTGTSLDELAAALIAGEVQPQEMALDADHPQ
jgi:hypothetical protein